MDNNLVDIIKSIVLSINTTLTVISINVNKIYLCNTLHLTIGKIVKDSLGNEYTITSFEINNFVIVEPFGHTDPFTGTILIAPDLTFLHGDPKSTNNEYSQLSNRSAAKTPFIWLVESYSYDDLPIDSAFDLSFGTRLFFLDWAETPKWSNTNHNDYVIKPMENLKRAFFDIIENDYNFKNLDSVKSAVRPRFGVGPESPDNLIIDEDLSGLDISFDLKVYDSGACCPAGEVVDVCTPAIEHITDSNGLNLYSDTIASGGVNTRIIQDAANTLNGAPISGVLAEGVKNIVIQTDDFIPAQIGVVVVDTKNQLTVEVPAAGTGVIGYVRPANNQLISYTNFDEGWQKINNSDPYVIPSGATVAQLDPNDIDLLKTLNAFGNYRRYTGYAGGYYQYSDSTYRDVNGVLSTEAAEFIQVGFGKYIIDNYTGIGWRMERGGSYSFVNGCAYVYGATIDGRSDWFVPSKNVIDSIIFTSYNSPLTRLPFKIQLNQLTSSVVANNPTAKYHQITAGGDTSFSQNQASFSAVSFMRYHFN